MFRRKEDGSEELINEPGTGDQAAFSSASSAAPSAPAAAATPAPATGTPVVPSAPSAPVMPSASAAAPSAPSFRPVPPQAAMAAARPAAPVASAPSAPSHTDSPRTASAPIGRPTAKRVLTVGPDIQMKGEITSCDRVVIEGAVDATMRDVHTVELTESGALKGTAEVEDAEISGSFEGDLVVRGKLTIYSSGRVRGNVTYGEIEIQRGGQISGNIRNVADVKNASGGQQPQNQQHKPKAA
jgi:cytoskeletal protein CcmA (bactofilin family)